MPARLTFGISIGSFIDGTSVSIRNATYWTCEQFHPKELKKANQTRRKQAVRVGFEKELGLEATTLFIVSLK